MTDLDLERLGGVWRRQLDSSELEGLQRAAVAVRRRARWGQLLDIALAVIVSGIVLLLVLSNPQTDTLFVGGAAILVLLGSHARTRRLRREELRALAGSTEEMLDQSIRRIQATVKRARFQLIALGPSIALGLLFARAADEERGGEIFRSILFAPWVGTGLVVLGALGAAALMAYFAHGVRNGRRELERLIVLRQLYRQEQLSGIAE